MTLTLFFFTKYTRFPNPSRNFKHLKSNSYLPSVLLISLPLTPSHPHQLPSLILLLLPGTENRKIKEQWRMDWDALVNICFNPEELNSVIHFVPATFFFRNNQHTTISLECKPRVCFNGPVSNMPEIAIYQEATEKKNLCKKEFLLFLSSLIIWNKNLNRLYSTKVLYLYQYEIKKKNK